MQDVIKLAKPFGPTQLAAAIRKVEMERGTCPRADRAPAVVVA